MISRLHISFVANSVLLTGPFTYAAPANLAPLAKIETPGEQVKRITDGLSGPDGEWAPETPHNTLWGYIGYPEIKLSRDVPQRINKVVIRDRPSPDNHFAACVHKFNDGSEVQVWAIPNDGSPETVVFEPRKVTTRTKTCVDGVGDNIGLSEVEVYYDPEARPDVRKCQLTDLVPHLNPTIETGRGRWFYCTPGSRPFGMISASSYTRNKNQIGDATTITVCRNRLPSHESQHAAQVAR